MGHRPPVDQKASPPALLVEDLDDAPPGAFEFYGWPKAHGIEAIVDAGILIKCPCGCGSETAMPFKRRGADDRPTWSWNGNREKPTCTPSLLIYQLDQTGKIIGEHWHGFLTDGQWRSC